MNIDRIYFGPIWDLDLAFDNDIILYPTNEKKNFAFKYIYSNGSTQTLVMKLTQIQEITSKEENQKKLSKKMIMYLF